VYFSAKRQRHEWRWR